MAGVDHADGFGQISENRRVVQIQIGGGVVTQDPRELEGSKKHNVRPPQDCTLNHVSARNLRVGHAVAGRVGVLTTGY